MNTIKIARAAAACLIVAAMAAGSSATLCAGQAAGLRQGAGLRQRISELYLLRLTRALDLTEEQTAKVYPLLTRAEKEKAEIQRKMGQDLRALREELAQPAPREKEIDALVVRIREQRRLIRRTDEDVEASLDRVLTPVQRARYVIFTVEFLRGLQDRLDRVRDLGPPAKRTP
jgi:Spy/CpxP family protein refolding chaperone